MALVRRGLMLARRRTSGWFANVGLLDEVIVMNRPVTLGVRRLCLRLEELRRTGDLACARFSVVRP